MQRQNRGLRKYAWVGNSIAEEDMAKMYAIKSEKKIPITKQVSNAVRKYLENKHD